MSMPYRSMLPKIALVIVALGLGFSGFVSHAQAPSAPAANVLQAYQELFALSQKEKKGLMFFVRGQTIGGGVTKIIGNEAVEVRNQTYGRIIIRIDRIDAVAMN